MKDAIDRVVGVVDETGAVIACSELNLIGEVQEDFVAERVSARTALPGAATAISSSPASSTTTMLSLWSASDETAAQFAAVLAISLQSIKQYHDEKFDKANFIKNVVAGQHPARRHLRQGAGTSLCHRCVPGGVHRPGGVGGRHFCL